MKPFENVKSIVTPLDKVNIDTDQIVPKQFFEISSKIWIWKIFIF